MTLSEKMTIERFSIMAEKDLGRQIQPIARQFKEFFTKVFEMELEDNERAQIKSNNMQDIARIIRGIAINAHLQDDIQVMDTLDLHYISITNYGAHELEWELMNNYGWCDRYHYALNN